MTAYSTKDDELFLWQIVSRYNLRRSVIQAARRAGTFPAPRQHGNRIVWKREDVQKWGEANGHIPPDQDE